jgi:flagellum-specific peptidoglycan hydrolase FlgJ
MTRESFVIKYYSFAKNIENEYGLPACLILAQSGIETGWGNSTPGNMMFGKKAGKKQLLRTTEYTSNLELAKKQYPEIIKATRQPNGKYLLIVRDWFVAYDSPIDSFRDYAKLISGKYFSGWQSFKNDPVLVAKHIAKKGYATSPNYGATLASIALSVDSIIKKKILESV